ncbi:hypothetical protein FMUND_13129 [Fusarium mundagurra]|uniref:Uncharacterized protein n=1 Tax=Fusarium mundagurra TaxID=1567541 RepID=A0A8H5Y039_9HYPO|nr:hypothetical protein FMUND_13129 [Fusarium mundagurra]
MAPMLSRGPLSLCDVVPCGGIACDQHGSYDMPLNLALFYVSSVTLVELLILASALIMQVVWGLGSFRGTLGWVRCRIGYDTECTEAEGLSSRYYTRSEQRNRAYLIDAVVKRTPRKRPGYAGETVASRRKPRTFVSPERRASSSPDITTNREELVRSEHVSILREKSNVNVKVTALQESTKEATVRLVTSSALVAKHQRYLCERVQGTGAARCANLTYGYSKDAANVCAKVRILKEASAPRAQR